jgi:flagella basal body P-ring formation protein FlgA
MRCSSKSTTWPASALALLLCVAPLGLSGQDAVPDAGIAEEAAVRRAILEAVRARVGTAADVVIDDLRFSVTGHAAGSLVATPESGARLACPVRFSLSRRADRAGAPPKLAGFAAASVRVSAEHLRAARALAAGSVLGPQDVTVAHDEVGNVPMRLLPGLDDITGARTLRTLSEGDVLSRSAVAVRPLVQSGDVVVVRLVAGSVQVEGTGVAAQSGSAGEIVRVVNPNTRRALQARVVGRGQVEVIQ